MLLSYFLAFFAKTRFNSLNLNLCVWQDSIMTHSGSFLPTGFCIYVILFCVIDSLMLAYFQQLTVLIDMWLLKFMAHGWSFKTILGDRFFLSRKVEFRLFFCFFLTPSVFCL